MEALGAAYVDEIRGVQPRGPDALVGYCFGGIVAFEMARQFPPPATMFRLLALLEPPGRADGRRCAARSGGRAAAWRSSGPASGPVRAARVGYALGRAVVLVRDQADRARRAGRVAGRQERRDPSRAGGARGDSGQR